MIRLPDDWRGGWVREPLNTAHDVCPTLAIFGGADHYTPADDIEALRARGPVGPTARSSSIPTDHGFVHTPDVRRIASTMPPTRGVAPSGGWGCRSLTHVAAGGLAAGR